MKQDNIIALRGWYMRNLVYNGGKRRECQRLLDGYWDKHSVVDIRREIMFEKIKEIRRKKEEEKERKLQEEKERLLALSDKELLVEILIELKRIEDGIDYVASNVRRYSS